MKVTVCVLTLVLAMLASSTVNCNSIAERSVGNENKTNFYDFSHSLNSFSFLKKGIQEVQVAAANTTTPPTTTRDWAAVCADLCKTGDGGVLCNCEMIPVRRWRVVGPNNFILYKPAVFILQIINNNNNIALEKDELLLFSLLCSWHQSRPMFGRCNEKLSNMRCGKKKG